MSNRTYQPNPPDAMDEMVLARLRARGGGSITSLMSPREDDPLYDLPNNTFVTFELLDALDRLMERGLVTQEKRSDKWVSGFWWYQLAEAADYDDEPANRWFED